MKSLVFLLFALVVFVASELPCPEGYPNRSASVAKQRPITLCERDDDDDFIYQDENSIWFNAKKEPIAHGTELFERPKRDGPVGENPYKAIDNANGSPNTKKDGSIKTRRNKGRKQKTNDFVSASSCPAEFPETKYNLYRDGICYRVCWNNDSNEPKYQSWHMGNTRWVDLDTFVSCPKDKLPRYARKN